MNAPNHQSNIALVRQILQQSPGFIEKDDPVYGKLFQCQFTPCCVPVAAIAWVNPDNEGVFIRIVFPAMTTAKTESLAALNTINANLPIGAFVLTESGEVRFKSAVFVGDAVAPTSILEHLFASAADMVRVEHRKIIQIITGTTHEHQDRR
jgi:putative sensory transduction regulator